ncbi:claudin-15-like [Neosynchiropus ocellatus]
MTRSFAQIVGLLLSILGLVLVGCTLALDHWRVAQVGGQGGSSVVATAWFWSDLWKDCYEDSTAVVNCVDFGVLWKVKSVSAMAGYCLYINRVVAAFLHSKADPSHVSYEMGPPLYVGLAGSGLVVIAAVVNWATVCDKLNPKRLTEHRQA